MTAQGYYRGCKQCTAKVAKRLDPANVSFRPMEEATSIGVLNGLREHLDAIVDDLEAEKEQKSGTPKFSSVA